MHISLDHQDARPIYVQIMDEVRRALVVGSIGPDDPLPSVRELASRLRVNPNTVAQAYRELERSGVAYVRRGQGTFVSPDVQPDGGERRALARDVARRAVVEAHRNGLSAEELIAAVREVASGGGGAGEVDDARGAGPVEAADDPAGGHGGDRGEGPARPADGDREPAVGEADPDRLSRSEAGE